MMGLDMNSFRLRNVFNDSEFIYFDAKSTESGVEDIKILSSDEIIILDINEFNYDSCFLIECIFLM